MRRARLSLSLSLSLSLPPPTPAIVASVPCAYPSSALTPSQPSHSLLRRMLSAGAPRVYFLSAERNHLFILVYLIH